jgi:hypothetical protein
MSGLWKKGIVIACVVSVSACASITGGRYQHVSVDAKANGQSITGANCTLSNDHGNVNVNVPGSAVVHRSSQALEVICRKDGAQVASQNYYATVRGMVWGNILFGGVIGLVVDFSNSAAQHYPNQLTLIANAPRNSDTPSTTTATTQYSSSETIVSQAAPQSQTADQNASQAQVAPQSGGPASLDSRVSKLMFSSAQDVASVQQCDRMIRVLNIEGEHALFFTQCSAGQQHLLHIECDGARCVPLLPPEA